MLDEELPALAAEVRREYEMFRVCATVLMKSGGRISPGLRNVLVHALNIHARALVEFFGGRKRRKPGDDLFASHFAASWDRGHHGHVDLVWLETALVPGIQKRTAHITAYRVRVSPDWDAQQILEIAMAITALLARLLHLLPPERRAWFDVDGAAPDIAWPYRDVLGMDVDNDVAARLLGAACLPLDCSC